MEKENLKPEWYQAAELELVYKTKVKPSQRPQVSSSVDIFKLFRRSWKDEKIEMVEEFKVAYLNRANRVLGVMEVATGGITGCVADPRIILAGAVKINAVNIVLVHNHPSGSLKPSRADEQLTAKIKEAAKFLDMVVMDHLIITDEEYYSFADEGLM